MMLGRTGVTAVFEDPERETFEGFSVGRVEYFVTTWCSYKSHDATKATIDVTRARWRLLVLEYETQINGQVPASTMRYLYYASAAWD